MAGVLVGAALLLPLVLSLVLAAGERWSSGAMSRWFFADARQQLSGLSLALMAMLIALAANVGVGTMVEGFRQTFIGWLDGRLVSELYIEAVTERDALEVETWLETRPEVTAVLPFWRAETRVAGWPVEVLGIRDHETYRVHFPLLSASPGAWDRLASGEGAMLSEQLARRLGARLGDRLTLPRADATWQGEIVAIFPDYGNPRGQVRLALHELDQGWADVHRTAMSVRLPPNEVEAVRSALVSAHGGRVARIIDQAALKQLSLSIFERTFRVTAALNTLTLVVSGIALVASLLTLGNVRLAQIAPVWAVGVTRRSLGLLELLKVVVLAIVTAGLAIPLGLVLAWCLVAIVNVQAFGWRLPMHVFPDQWLEIVLLAAVTSVVASLGPIWRLARRQPQDLLRVFANER